MLNCSFDDHNSDQPGGQTDPSSFRGLDLDLDLDQPSTQTVNWTQTTSCLVLRTDRTDSGRHENTCKYFNCIIVISRTCPAMWRALFWRDVTSSMDTDRGAGGSKDSSILPFLLPSFLLSFSPLRTNWTLHVVFIWAWATPRVSPCSVLHYTSSASSFYETKFQFLGIKSCHESQITRVNMNIQRIKMNLLVKSWF